MTRDEIGFVDGSTTASTRRFTVFLKDDAVVQLDDLVMTKQVLPNGKELEHYGIVVEGSGTIEGAEFPSDTARIVGTKTMPGETTRGVDVQVLRTVPELWMPPDPGAEVFHAEDESRKTALFMDTMGKLLPVGLDQGDRPVYADFEFINGEKGGHLSISGISGVATKTSYALFFLYMLFETRRGQELLGEYLSNTKALVFNVKGEDLLHLDRRNTNFTPEQAERWIKLGAEEPAPFSSVRVYVPPAPTSTEASLLGDVDSRDHDEVRVYGFTPYEFIREVLLRFLIADDGKSQISFVEQRVRLQLARHAFPLQNEEGAALMVDTPPAGTSMDMERVVHQGREPRVAGDGTPIRNFSNLVDYVVDKLAPDGGHEDPAWTGSTQANTVMAFVRRLYAQRTRMGHLIRTGVRRVELEERINVVDINKLHDDAQRFVVGVLLERIFREKQGSGRNPLRFILLDELNKYAPKGADSPIKEILVDIAARGRSLGVILIGAQQSASEVEGAIIRNASIKVVGRLDAGEAAAYRFLSPELRERTTRFMPGTMVVDQPAIPAPIPVKFPFPPYATAISEAAEEMTEQDEEEIFERL